MSDFIAWRLTYGVVLNEELSDLSFSTANIDPKTDAVILLKAKLEAAEKHIAEWKRTELKRRMGVYDFFRPLVMVRLAIPVSFLRAFIEFIVPIVVAVYALWLLNWRLP
jgi:hypothetical protein